MQLPHRFVRFGPQAIPAFLRLNVKIIFTPDQAAPVKVAAEEPALALIRNGLGANEIEKITVNDQLQRLGRCRSGGAPVFAVNFLMCKSLMMMRLQSSCSTTTSASSASHCVSLFIIS
jgi:hypothetical protein